MNRHTATADATLPLEEFAEVAEVDQLRAALADLLDYYEHPDRPAPANRVRAWRALAGRAVVPGLEDTTPAERGEEGSARAAARWTDEEAAQVDAAIRAVATALLEFTTADVWAELGPGFPITKGIAAKMLAAARAGLIVNTGRTTYNDSPDRAHAHGQRLAVWRAL